MSWGDFVLGTTISVLGNRIRLTYRQWAHIVVSHDYMAGNSELVLGTIAEPDVLAAGEAGEVLALWKRQ